MMTLKALPFLCALALLLSGSGVALGGQAAKNQFSDVVRKTEPLVPEEERRTFVLPPGFEAQLVASEPDIAKPINMSFDAAGRLWITDSREYPFPVKEGAPGRDSIKILSNFSESGKAQKITTFADGLNVPIGVLPYGRGALGHSIPYIHYFEDTHVAPGSCAAL
ncbi:MAG: cytochrome C, partial [Planctomycetota bacterium]